LEREVSIVAIVVERVQPRDHKVHSEDNRVVAADFPRVRMRGDDGSEEDIVADLTVMTAEGVISVDLVVPYASR
jgi:hypothetical protein